MRTSSGSAKKPGAISSQFSNFCYFAQKPGREDIFEFGLYGPLSKLKAPRFWTTLPDVASLKADRNMGRTLLSWKLAAKIF